MKTLRRMIAGRGKSLALLAGFVILPIISAQVEAHDPGLSAVDVRLAGNRITASVTLARPDVEAVVRIDQDRDGDITAAEFDAVRADLESIASSAFEIQIDGADVPPAEVSAALGESNTICLRLSFNGEARSRLSIRSMFLQRLPRGHRQYVTITDAHGHQISEQMLDINSPAISPALGNGLPPAAPGSFSQFLLLGIEHIWTGYDHLVFLMGLLIAGATFRSSAKIITSFTIAHSITLALGTLGIVRISPAIVEPLIAISIIYVGIENLWRRQFGRRWLLTLGFGLIHGFGFASVLNELGIGSDGAGAAIPLLSFNMGVEIGQIAIAAVCLPLIWKLQARPSFAARFVPACSVLVALAGGFWLVERIR